MKNILPKLNDEGEIKLEEEIKVARMGKYEMYVARPMKVTLRGQAITVEMLIWTCILKEIITIKVYISGGIKMQERERN